MFESFFPSPRAFFISAALWTVTAVLFWFLFARHWGDVVGLPNRPADAPPIIGVQVFWSDPFLWFYAYFSLVVALFAGFWAIYAPHRWFRWSVLGRTFTGPRRGSTSLSMRRRYSTRVEGEKFGSATTATQRIVSSATVALVTS